MLLENLSASATSRPDAVLPPLTDAAWGYRRKGRFSVRRVEKKDKTLVGFREQDPRFVADLSQCHTVIPEIGIKIARARARWSTAWTRKRDDPADRIHRRR